MESEYVDNVDVIMMVDDRSVGDSVDGEVVLLNEGAITGEEDGTPEENDVAVKVIVVLINEVAGESVEETDSDGDAVMTVMIVALTNDVAEENVAELNPDVVKEKLVVLVTTMLDVETNADDEIVSGAMVVLLLYSPVPKPEETGDPEGIPDGAVVLCIKLLVVFG